MIASLMSIHCFLNRYAHSAMHREGIGGRWGSAAFCIANLHDR